MITGTPKFNSLALGELAVNFIRRTEEGPAISVKAAFLNSETGTSHGWTTAGAGHGGPKWSPAVYEKLAALKEQLELETAQLHLEDVAGAPDGPQHGEQVGGLGEHLDSSLGNSGFEAPPA